jgi:hypothetical protein
MAQTAGRGTSWVSVVLGWLAALGAALILLISARLSKPQCLAAGYSRG